jgi:hypothetical protein
MTEATGDEICSRSVVTSSRYCANGKQFVASGRPSFNLSLPPSLHQMALPLHPLRHVPVELVNQSWGRVLPFDARNVNGDSVGIHSLMQRGGGGPRAITCQFRLQLAFIRGMQRLLRDYLQILYLYGAHYYIYSFFERACDGKQRVHHAPPQHTHRLQLQQPQERAIIPQSTSA